MCRFDSCHPHFLLFWNFSFIDMIHCIKKKASRSSLFEKKRLAFLLLVFGSKHTCRATHGSTMPKSQMAPCLRHSRHLHNKKAAHTMYSFQSRWIQGFEPWASRATIWRANQLRYTHHINIKLINEPEGIRTPDPRLRRPLLYPAELQTHLHSFAQGKRVMGIEPTYLAWKASVLPLNYTRKI